MFLGTAIFATLFIVDAFAFELIGSRWNKEAITWGIEQNSKVLTKSVVTGMIKEAFGKWSAETSLKITGPVAKPDISIKFDPNLDAHILCRMEFNKGGEFERGVYIADSKGARIYITDDINRADLNDEWYAKAKNVLLRQVGHTLGLDISPVKNSVMARTDTYELDKLQEDDIRGIRKLYGPPQSKNSSGAKWSII